MALQIFIPVIAVAAFLLGIFGVISSKCTRCPVRAGWSNMLVLAVIFGAGVLCLCAAVAWPRGVLPSGLVLSLLLIAALWGNAAHPELEN